MTHPLRCLRLDRPSLPQPLRKWRVRATFTMRAARTSRTPVPCPRGPIAVITPVRRTRRPPLRARHPTAPFSTRRSPGRFTTPGVLRGQAIARCQRPRALLRRLLTRPARPAARDCLRGRSTRQRWRRWSNLSLPTRSCPSHHGQGSRAIVGVACADAGGRTVGVVARRRPSGEPESGSLPSAIPGPADRGRSSQRSGRRPGQGAPGHGAP
jgi:hypothetical protein